MKIGYAFCGSHCTLKKSLAELKKLCESFEIIPIVSEVVYSTDTRFFLHDDFIAEVRSITGLDPIHTIKDAEPLGPHSPLDAMIIAPCTGNTLAKIALGITDSCVSMAAKAHLRSNRPLLISLSTNDALSANLKNIAELIERKSVFFVPMIQDDPKNKPHSLVCDYSLLIPSLENALNGKQSYPIFVN